MRKILHYILLALATGACITAEQDNPFIGPTCYDRIRNQDETAIDCGGHCSACGVSEPELPTNEPPCKATLQDNTLVIDGRKVVAAMRDYSCDISTAGYTIAILIDGIDSFVLHLGGSGKPTKSDTYSLVQTIYSVPSGSACIYYEEGGYDGAFTNYGDKVYVTVTKDKKITVEFCDIELVYGYGGYFRTVSGRISGCVQ
jgi:hypothetical protein